MANLAQLVNVIAPIVTTPEAAYLRPIYYPFLFHSQSALDYGVDVMVQGQDVSAPPEPAGRWQPQLADLAPFSLIDAVATTDANRGKVSVALVNRQREGDQTVELCLRDFVFAGDNRVRILTEDLDRSKRVRADIVGVKVEETTIPVKGSVASLTVPPECFVVVESDIAGD